MAEVLDDDPRIIEFDVRTDEMLVNMGPQHPSTHGVLRLVLRTDGEVVSEIEPHIGYLHRCAEKIGENLTHRQFIPYTDRMDYLAAMNMNLGWALAVEKLMKYQVSEKARHLRVLIAELNRIAILHLHALELGLSPAAQVDRGAGLVTELDVAGDEVGMEVGEEHVLDRVAPGRGVFQILVDVPLRIDHGRRLRLLVGDHVGGVGQAGQVVLLDLHGGVPSGAGDRRGLPGQ